MARFLEFLCYCIVLLLIETINASKLWVQENIGDVTNWFYNKDSTKAYVATKQAVIAALDLQNNGDILWRQVLDKDDVINEFSDCSDGKSLLSLSNGNIIRKWKKFDGSLIWESRQFTKNKADQNRINGDMQILTSNKILLIDNLDILSVYDLDEGTLIWKQDTNANAKKNLYKQQIEAHSHKIYTDEASKTVYIITFYADSVNVDSYSLTTGEPVRSTSDKYDHECSSLPSRFEVISSPDSTSSLIVSYDCISNDNITPLYAFLFSSNSFQITPLSVSFDTPNPSLNEWTLNNQQLNAAYCQVYDVKIDTNSKSVSLSAKQKKCENISTNDPKFKYRGNIKYIWQQTPQSSAIGILTDDGSLCFVDKANKNEWCREESLASPLYVHLFDESEDESSLCNEEMNEEQCEAAYHAPFPPFSQRLSNDIASVLTLSGFSIVDITKRLNTFFPITSSWLDATYENIITILTQHGKLFGLSSTNGDILWSINLKYLCAENDGDNDGNYDIVTMLSLRQHPPHLVIILGDVKRNKSKIVSVSSPFHTQQTPHIHVESVSYFIKSAFVTPWISKEHSDKITILISDNDKISIYPFNEERRLESNLNSIFYHSLSSESATLSGYNLQKSESKISASTIWRKSFVQSDEEIVDVVFSLHDQFVVNSVYRTGEKGSIYKYLNPHLIGIATIERGHNKLHIYLMDGVTGRVYLHQYHNNVQVGYGGMSLLLYENKFVYTLYNTKTLMTEITSIDLWLSDPQNVPTKGRTPAEGYVHVDNPLENNVFSSFNAPLPFITSQSYNFAFVIDELLCVTNTRYSVSNKWILAKLASGSIVQIDSKWLNTRRPITYDSTPANKEEQLIPYKKHIPFSNFMTISQENTLGRVNRAVSVGSPIESTSLFFAFGDLDLFFSTIKPSKNFDTIPADFDYPMLALILGGVVIGIVVAKKMVQTKKINKEWK